MNNIEMECGACPVSNTCPSRGSSPLLADRKRVLCRIVGGFGRTPVDKDILSTESLAVSEKNGPCLTIAEVPRMDDGLVVFDVVKVFSPPVLADREKNPTVTSSDLTPRSHNP